MAPEVGAATGIGFGEKNPSRLTQRNGYRDRDWETRAGTVELRIPKLRAGSYFPGFLELRQMAETAPTAVIQEPMFRAFPRGPSTTSSRRWACRASPKARFRGSVKRLTAR